jgi:hypothetical protein
MVYYLGPDLPFVELAEHGSLPMNDALAMAN